MNYPKPNTFSSITVRDVPTYLTVPGYKFTITLDGPGSAQSLSMLSGVTEEFDEFDEFDDDVLSADIAPSENNVTQPYIITITNYMSADVHGVKILGAFENSMATNHGLPGGIEITMGNVNINYSEFLAHIQHQPFRVALLRLTSTNAAQVTQALRVKKMSAFGFNERILPIPLDPYAQVNTVVSYPLTEVIDGGIGFEINMLASTELKLYLYPNAHVNLRIGLGGMPVEQNLGNPGIISSVRAVINENSINALRN